MRRLEGRAVSRTRDTEWQQWVDFALRWEPFGGGDDYILPEFGVSPAVFYRRLLNDLDRTPPSVTSFESEKLTRLCNDKLRRADRKHPYPLGDSNQ